MDVCCLLEAEYAFERRTLIIPVLTELDYTADGWLGMIIGTKYRYNLVKPEKCERELNSLIRSVDQLRVTDVDLVSGKLAADFMKLECL